MTCSIRSLWFSGPPRAGRPRSAVAVPERGRDGGIEERDDAGDPPPDDAQDVHAVRVVAPVRGPPEDHDRRIAVGPRRDHPEVPRAAQDPRTQEPGDGVAPAVPGGI